MKKDQIIRMKENEEHNHRMKIIGQERKIFDLKVEISILKKAFVRSKKISCKFF